MPMRQRATARPARSRTTPIAASATGMSSAVIPAADKGARPPAHRTYYVPYASAVPDRFVDTLLRPPLTLVS